MHLTLTTTVRVRLVELARNAWPRECCGLVSGPTPSVGDDVALLANVAARPSTSFAFDDGQHAMTRRAIARAGRHVVAIFHSHPRGRATPSRADCDAFVVDGAPLFPGEAMLIVGRDEAGAAHEIRAHVLDAREGVLRERTIEWLTSDGPDDPLCST